MVDCKGLMKEKELTLMKYFSPIMKHSSINVLLAIVALFHMELQQFDVKTTFLHGVLEEEIYVHQQEGFLVQGKEDHSCLLKKSIYGLKQSPRPWFYVFMIGHGYNRSNYDNYIYHRRLLYGFFIYLLFYVDDMLIISKSMVEMNN